MRVLVVDDDPVTLEMVSENLAHYGYDVTTASDGQQAYELVRTGRFRLVVSDWEMPHMTGLQLCREIRKRSGSGYVYFLLLTSNTGLQNCVQGLEAGADDFLTKPFQPEELRQRLRTGERILSLESRDLMIFAMAKLTESRDNETGAHLERMREYSRILAEELSDWPEYSQVIDGNYVQMLYLTSPLHDIGKVGVPDAVLLKPGKLTSEEFDVMKTHTTLGGDTLAALVQARPEAEFLVMAKEIALTHHERFDGRGYPRGLKGTEIPLCGRIVSVADVYDALTSKRVYKAAFTHEEARKIILEGRGTQFDSDVVQAFLNRESEFIETSRKLGDGPQRTPVDLMPRAGAFENGSALAVTTC